MAGTPALRDVQTLGGEEVSIRGIYAPANLDIEVRHDESDLPSRPTVRIADLHAMMTAFRSVPAPPDAWKLHVLVVTEDDSEPGLFGIMFDFGDEDENDLPREGCAVYATAHEALPGGVAPEMLLTTVHELAHCFNLHHSDWEGASFQRDSTIEGYAFTDSVRWALSSRSLEHILSHPASLVRPGAGGFAFGVITPRHLERHQSVPDNPAFFEVVDPEDLPANARRSAPRFVSLERSAPAIPRDAAARQAPLELHLEPPKRSFAVGEPVVLTVGLHNEGTTPQTVLSLLHPDYRFLHVEIREPGSREFRPFRPAVLAEARRLATERLAAGEAIHETVPIFFGADGWSFEKAGRYAVRVDYPSVTGDPPRLRGPEDRLRSGPIEIEIVDPPGERAAAAKRLALGKQQGLYLLFEGGDHLRDGQEKLRQLAERFPDSAQAAAARTALGIAALKPTLTRGGAGPVRLEEAQRYLAGVLDSDQPPLVCVGAQATLADELERRGRAAEAADLRRAITTKFSGEESVRREVRRIRETLPPR